MFLLSNLQGPSSSTKAVVHVSMDVAVVENGVNSMPAKDEVDSVVDKSCEEVTAIAKAPEEKGENLKRQKSPTLPIPDIPASDLSSPEIQDKKSYSTDEEGQLTPSGTMMRNGTLDE